MSVELLSVAGITAIVSVVITILFQYLPGLRQVWAGLKTEVKKAIILAMYIVVGAIVAFGGCVPALLNLVPGLLCVAPPAFLSYVIGVLIAIGAGQGIFAIMPELSDVAAIKEARPA